nr:MAG TPA: hypothetical protein [Caudoviricetes sp.]
MSIGDYEYHRHVLITADEIEGYIAKARYFKF